MFALSHSAFNTVLKKKYNKRINMCGFDLMNALILQEFLLISIIN